jgi:hypothetical protein
MGVPQRSPIANPIRRKMGVFIGTAGAPLPAPRRATWIVLLPFFHNHAITAL